MNYKISVIVPVYNSEKYLKKCIDSILNQDFKEYKIILVDDGSTDTSGSICDEYAKENDNICVIHTKNNGVASARKIGVQKSDTEYIMFVDSDDWIDRQMIGDLYMAVEENKCDIAACEYYSDYPNREIKSISKIKDKKIYKCKEDILRDILTYKGIYVWLVNKIFKKKLFDGVDYLEGVNMGEDYGVLIQLIGNADRLIYLSDNRYHYRQNDNSACHSNFMKMNETWNKFLVDAEKYKKLYPQLKNLFEVKVYIEEIGGLVLMCRANKIDDRVRRRVQRDIRKNIFKILFTKGIDLKYKVSAFCIFVNINLFCFLYKFGSKILKFI